MDKLNLISEMRSYIIGLSIFIVLILAGSFYKTDTLIEKYASEQRRANQLQSQVDFLNSVEPLLDHSELK